MRKRVGPGVSKAVAGRTLGVSTNTLDKWIARGRVPTVRDNGGRQLVALLPLVELGANIKRLREVGQTDGLLAAAILELEQRDHAYQREFDELYRDSLNALKHDELVPATVPDSLGSDD
jgi:hypothetical protein